MPRDRESILDMLDAIGLIQQYVQGVTREGFGRSIQLQDAVIRRIEVLGEAAKRVSAETRDNHPEVPWKNIAGMRDRVIHGYDSIDLNVVWDTIQKDIPKIEAPLRDLVDA